MVIEVIPSEEDGVDGVVDVGDEEDVEDVEGVELSLRGLSAMGGIVS